MKCEEAEKKIYLYRELSQTEQREVDRHVSTCKTCWQLMQSTRHVDVLLRKAAIVIPQPKNHAQLTLRILTSIKKKEEHSFISTLFDYLNGYFTRYAFAVLSVVLVTVFVSEYSQERVVLQQNLTVTQAGPTLDTQFFHEKIQQRIQHKDEQPISYYSYYKKHYTDKSI